MFMQNVVNNRYHLESKVFMCSAVQFSRNLCIYDICESDVNTLKYYYLSGLPKGKKGICHILIYQVIQRFFATT